MLLDNFSPLKLLLKRISFASFFLFVSSLYRINCKDDELEVIFKNKNILQTFAVQG
jgi:hypothetical protein